MARRAFKARTPSQRIPVWVGLSVVPTSVGSSGVILAISNAALNLLRPFTIIRTRMVFLITSDQGASETTSGVFAGIVVQEEAAVAGLGSVPIPIEEPSAPFFMFEPYVHELQFDSAVGTQSPAGTLTRIDSKAMRKVGLTETVVLVAECESAQAALITAQGRMLIKLH